MSYAEEKCSEAWSEQCARKYQYKNATRTVKHLIVNVGRRDVSRKKRPDIKHISLMIRTKVGNYSELVITQWSFIISKLV